MHSRWIDYLDEHLVNLAAGVYRDQGYVGIIVMAPPRHGKSEECSHNFPAWYLGARPDNRVILCSYEAGFAASWGGKVRNTLQAHGPSLYGIDISQTSSARDQWEIANHRGGMMTAGVGGAITGRGGDLLIIDDPVKNSQDAQSPTVRQNQWMWYKSTFRTRLQPGGVILIIGTRWHEDDLIGRIVNEMKEDLSADQFLVIRFPAIAEAPSEDYPEPDALGREPGEALFPQMWPPERLIPYQSNSYTWSALYQQRPAPAEGGVFNEEWFEIVPTPDMRKMRKIVRRWDMAATDEKKAEDPDWTVGILMGEHEDGNCYILDMTRTRGTPGQISSLQRRTCMADGYRTKQRVEQEPGSAGKTAIWYLARGPFRGYSFRGVRSTGNKILRAESFADAAERGDIKLCRGRWNRDWLREVCRFPFDAHDDIVDASSGAYEDLTKRANKMVTA